MARRRRFFVYILTNTHRTVLYTGVTSNILQRIQQHKEKHFRGFTSRYNVDKLVYLEACDNAREAITREKQIKSGSRRKKLDLIEAFNPEWRNLAGELRGF